MDHSDFLSKNAAIALALGANVVKVSDLDSCVKWSDLAVDGIVIDLHFDGYHNKNRVSVGVAWPKYADGKTMPFSYVAAKYDDVSPSITVSLDKSADKIAADIKRRLLPIAAPLYAKALANVADHDNYDAKKRANYAALAAACGGSVFNNGSDHVRGLPSGVDVKYVNADSVTLVLDLSIADACAMIAARKAAA